jgi:phage terminase large subunit-like protein
MPQVLKEVPDAQLLICGEGKEKSNLVKLVDDQGRDCGDGIVYIEHVEDFQEQSGQAERVIRQRADLDASEVGRHPIRMEEEPGASGKANTVNYRTKVLPMYDYKGERASGAKPVRFVPFANQAEAGNVYLVRGAWNSRYLDALEGLPDAGWDHADATSGAYNYLAGIDRAQGRIRVIEGGVGKRGDGAQPARKTDVHPEGTVPVYDRGRFIGYERELRDALSGTLYSGTSEMQRRIIARCLGL